MAEIPNGTPDSMRQLIDQMRRKAGSVAALLASRGEGKVTLVAGISRDLEEKLVHAGQWVGTVAQVVGGKGGGRPDMAQAGGKDPEKLPAALEAARQKIRSLLGG